MTARPTRPAPVIRGGGRPLTGVTVTCPTDDLPAAAAAGLLEQLGATVVESVTVPDEGLAMTIAPAGDGGAHGSGSRAPIARLVGDVPDQVPGLPPATIPYACGIATAGAAVLALLSSGDVEVDGREVALQVLLPVVLAAEYGSRHREPAPPRRVAGGALACDLATADDEATFERLLEAVGPTASPREIADEAQTWRLPVCEYARRRTEVPDRWGTPAPARPAPARPARPPSGARTPPPLAGVTVADLTAMWAGPLATWLLAGAGADVHKIESQVRPDGMRGLDGGGIHPAGTDVTTGTTSAMFNALNRSKTCRDLHLGLPAGRDAFCDLVGHSDVVIDSFSRRVMPNFGLAPEALQAARRGIASVSLPAFPPEHPWQVALGPAVHAASGLGHLGGGRFAAPVVAYPDPLTGLTAFVVAAALVAGSRRGVETEHAEVTLLDATAPLADLAPPDPVLRARDPELGRRLLDDPDLADAWETLCDGAGRHRYPRHPFRGSWAPIPSTPAPAPARGGTAR